MYLLFKEILAGKTRLFLTILAIAWATTTITFMLAVGEGLRLTLGNTTSSIGKNFMVVMGGQTSSTHEGHLPNQPVRLTPQDLAHIRQGIPNIQIMPEYQWTAAISYQGQSLTKSISAVYPDFAHLRNLSVQTGGRFIDDIDIKENRRVIVIGTEFAKEVLQDIHLNQLLGKILIIDQKPFKIIGVLAEKPPIGFYQMPDNYLAWIPASTYIIEKKPEEISNFLIFPQPNSQNENLKKQIIQLIASHHHLDPEDQNILNILDIQKRQQETQSALKGTEIFLGIVGAMTLVVAGVGIANVMFISVRRTTREIGIRMAIGARSGQILWRYITEALIATFVGGAIGITLAYGLVWGISQLPMDNPMFKYIGKPMPIFSFTVVGIVITTLGLVGLLAGFFPAKRAAAIDPAEALRHE